MGKNDIVRCNVYGNYDRVASLADYHNVHVTVVYRGSQRQAAYGNMPYIYVLYKDIKAICQEGENHGVEITYHGYSPTRTKGGEKKRRPVLVHAEDSREVAVAKALAAKYGDTNFNARYHRYTEKDEDICSLEGRRQDIENMVSEMHLRRDKIEVIDHRLSHVIALADDSRRRRRKGRQGGGRAPYVDPETHQRDPYRYEPHQAKDTSGPSRAASRLRTYVIYWYSDHEKDPIVKSAMAKVGMPIQLSNRPEHLGGMRIGYRLMSKYKMSTLTKMIRAGVGGLREFQKLDFSIQET